MMLIFSTQEDAEAALTMVNEAYGCPYQSDVYFMDTWDTVMAVGEKFGFTTPEDRCGKTAEEVIAAIQNIVFLEAEG